MAQQSLSRRLAESNRCKIPLAIGAARDVLTRLWLGWLRLLDEPRPDPWELEPAAASVEARDVSLARRVFAEQGAIDRERRARWGLPGNLTTSRGVELPADVIDGWGYDAVIEVLDWIDELPEAAA